MSRVHRRAVPISLALAAGLVALSSRAAWSADTADTADTGETAETADTADTGGTTETAASSDTSSSAIDTATPGTSVSTRAGEQGGCEPGGAMGMWMIAAIPLGALLMRRRKPR